MTPERPLFGSRASARRHVPRRGWLLAPILAAAIVAACAGAPARPIVEVITQGGAIVRVPVELARTREELSRGLMWRDDLPRDAGMLFVFDHDAERAFWMKNTPLSLDIVFIDRAGKVLNVAENTTPFSTAPIRSAGAARYVLEVHTGFARRHGIRVGDAVRLPDLASVVADRVPER